MKPELIILRRWDTAYSVMTSYTHKCGWGTVFALLEYSSALKLFYLRNKRLKIASKDSSDLSDRF